MKLAVILIVSAFLVAAVVCRVQRVPTLDTDELLNIWEAEQDIEDSDATENDSPWGEDMKTEELEMLPEDTENEMVEVNEQSVPTQHQRSKVRRSRKIKHARATCSQELLDVEDVPDSLDWRTQGYVTEVKSQLPQQCLHSIYFTTTGALEGQWFRKTGNLISLSEQNLADCCGAGSEQCNNVTGTPCSLDQVYNFIVKSGIESLAQYPDTRADQKCAFDPKKAVATCDGYYFVTPAGNESALQRAVASHGPIAVMIDSTQPSFAAYTGGVYNEPKCSSTVPDRNILVVGYGTDPTGGDYWIAKNSWGPNWGEGGYIRMSRNRDNQCGIASTASYPYFTC
ncbi:Cathepsin L [Hypsibius exemplaris]|uniref:Cathepsin L n=1 Tax=Hypsibius exemplaris TaxID=2072580 RepID=A0A1W0WPF9_HYPEX|nr:Cathepsin L [Hypsibius exemplaris]